MGSNEPHILGADQISYPGVYYRHGKFPSEIAAEVARKLRASGSGGRVPAGY